MKHLIGIFVITVIALGALMGVASADNPHPKPAQDVVYQCFNDSGAIEATRGALNHKPTCAHTWDKIEKWDADRA